MDSFIEKIYLREIIKQASCAINCHEKMNQYLSLVLMKNCAPIEDLFREIEHFIQHVAAISFLLWPSSTKEIAKSRSEYLRKILKINDDNMLKRAVRNHLVHFDERLDSWVNESTRHNFIDQNIGDLNTISGLDKNDCMRNFNPKTNEYSVLGDTYDIQEIFEKVKAIRQAASDVSNYPLPPAGEGGA